MKEQGIRKFWNNIDWVKTGKIAIGCCIAILISDYFKLRYSASAGIITLLSIQDTKKATVTTALNRWAAFILAVLSAFLSFSLFGFHPIGFGMFLILFVPLCMVLDLQAGISMCAVLMTHFLIEKSMSFYWLKNECFLMAVGTGMGILLNSYMPRYTVQIREKQNKIEMEIRLILKGISTYLTDPEKNFSLKYDFKLLEHQIEEAMKQAYNDNDNILSYDVKYYIKYMEMRKSQAVILKTMMEGIRELSGLPDQAQEIASFIEGIIMTLRESNNALKLLSQLDKLKYRFRREELPKSREEFEDRAVLYNLLSSLEQFLEFKRSFAEELTDEEKSEYWGQFVE